MEVGSVLVMVHTTIFVSDSDRCCGFFRLTDISRSHSQGSCACEFDDSLWFGLTDTTLQLNLEVPAHDFNEAEGKLIVGLYCL